MRRGPGAGTLALAILRGEDEEDDEEEEKMTAEEFRAYRAAHEARIKHLRELAERIRVELEAKGRQKPA